MFIISKQFNFSASHILEGLPDDHPCSRLHGHNYIIEVVLEGDTLNAVGFVRDYNELSVIKSWIDHVLDHRHLNECVPGQPSAENLAKYIYDRFKDKFPELVAIRVSETPKTWAEFRYER